MIEIAEALNGFIEQYLYTLWTGMPCKVVAVEDAGGETRLSVKPLLNSLYPDGTVKERPVILNVPCIMPGTQDSMVHIPVKKDTIVWCLFSQRCLDSFKEGDGSPQAPADYRIFDMADAVALPGINPFKKNPNLSRTLDHSGEDLSLTHNIGSASEVTLRLTPTGEVKIVSPAKVSVECLEADVDATVLNINAATTNWAGNINYTGVFTINGMVFDLHTHSGVTPGTGASGPVVI